MKEILHRPDVAGLRLETLTAIRWIAVIGQLFSVLFVYFYLDFDFPIVPSLAVIGLSAALNIFMRFRFPSSVRWHSPAIIGLLSYDVLQLGALLYLTGGINNPFSILLAVPVVVSAATQETLETLVMAILALGVASLLVFFYFPLPWYGSETFDLPMIYRFGIWAGLASTITFTALYAFRVADESRKLSAALAATELILQREQHLISLDGIAAAAAHELGTPLATISLVSKEMQRELPKNSPFLDDAKLLRSQAERCREILRKLSSMPHEEDLNVHQMKIGQLMQEIAELHQNTDIAIEINITGESPNPVTRRNPAIIHGISNFLENAVDFARSKVDFEIGWDEQAVSIMITDDGPGFPLQALENVGEPYFSARSNNKVKSGGGLGLGAFIAKTLLTRSGASVTFKNIEKPGKSGARIEIRWQREIFEYDVKQA